MAQLKGRLLVKCDLPEELKEEVNQILDWTLPDQFSRLMVRIIITYPYFIFVKGFKLNRLCSTRPNSLLVVKEISHFDVRNDQCIYFQIYSLSDL